MPTGTNSDKTPYVALQPSLLLHLAEYNMSRDILAEVKTIMCDVFDVDDLDISKDTTARDIEEWDSLSHIRLIVAIEQHFGIKFTSLEVEGFKSVGDLVAAVAKKTGTSA